MKGWHWLHDRILSLTPVPPAQLSTMLIPFYLSPLSPPTHISLCTFCCPCIYTLSYPSLALSSSPPRRSFIPRFICSSSPPLCSLFYASHTFPAHPSLMLIYVAGYSWVNTIFVQAKQAPEAAFIYQEHFSSSLFDMCSACSLMCSPFFCAMNSWPLWLFHYYLFIY